MASRKVRGLPRDGRVRALLRSYAHAHGVSQKKALKSADFKDIRKTLTAPLPKEPSKRGKTKGQYSAARKRYKAKLKETGQMRMLALQEAGYTVVNPWEAYVQE